MTSKSNIVLIVLGALLSFQFLFSKSLIFFPPFNHWHHHDHWIFNSSGFLSFVGIILIILGLYKIYKENKTKKK